MLFNSIAFLLFFPIVTVIYFLLPHQFRWMHLLLASCIFYTFFIPVYILILFFTIIVDYFAGIAIEESQTRKKKFFLLLSLIANIGVLAIFKYYNFFIENINFLFHESQSSFSLPLLSILLPIGLSFHTFQAMSYTIEVYRGNQKAERHFGIYSLYVMFYPQLVAGPIERPQNLLPQFREKHFINYSNVTSGLRLMAWGMFKKVVIADRLVILVNEVFNHPANYYGLSTIVAIIFFSIQIYCDFSGYSDIAIGSARVMGFTLMRNFNTPYFSKSIPEFWKRWHISLSSWFRDYLYISIGGNRKGKVRSYVNQFIVFLISGFWHGANWTYIFWGFLHGVFITITNFLKPVFQPDKIISFWFVKYFRIIFTFSIVTIAWVFFRANSLSDSFLILNNACNGLYEDLFLIVKTHQILNIIGYFNGFEIQDWIISFIAVIILLFVDILNYKNNAGIWINKQNFFFRWSIYLALIYSIIIFGKFEEQQFIYFQF